MFLIETLIDWGVDVVFGLPGDGINGLMESLRTHQNKFDSCRCGMKSPQRLWPADMRNLRESSACAWPRPVLAESICSTAYTTPRWMASPCLALTGLQFHDLIGTYTQQDVALDRLYMDVAACNERIMGPTHVEN